MYWKELWGIFHRYKTSTATLAHAAILILSASTTQIPILCHTITTGHRNALHSNIKIYCQRHQDFLRHSSVGCIRPVGSLALMLRALSHRTVVRGTRACKVLLKVAFSGRSALSIHALRQQSWSNWSMPRKVLVFPE